MSLTPDRQGYIGDLMLKTMPELKELLERQEKILSKRALLEHLPDKGEKARKFADHLKEVIKLKQDGKNPLLSSDEDVIKRNPALSERLTISSEEGKSRQSDTVTVNGDSTNILQIEQNVKNHERKSLSRDGEVNVDPLASRLEQISIGGGLDSQSEMPTDGNSYERVMKKAADTSLNRKQKFMPNRPRHDAHHQIPKHEPDIRLKDDDKMKEESAAYPPHYKFEESKLISLEESVQLIEQQRAKNEMLNAERAAKKLADQLMPKMDNYSPSAVDMQYREAADEEEEYDSDDEHDVVEYD